MKLIIDVPKEVYELIINDNSTKMIGFAKAVKNGIPLEQIRDKISAILTNSYDEGVKEKALQIIDKI